MKPLSTLARGLDSVDLETGEPARSAYERSDVTAVPACGVIAEAMLAFVLADALLELTGGDRLEDVEVAPRRAPRARRAATRAEALARTSESRRSRARAVIGLDGKQSELAPILRETQPLRDEGAATRRRGTPAASAGEPFKRERGRLRRP